MRLPADTRRAIEKIDDHWHEDLMRAGLTPDEMYAWGRFVDSLKQRKAGSK